MLGVSKEDVKKQKEYEDLSLAWWENQQRGYEDRLKSQNLSEKEIQNTNTTLSIIKGIVQ